MSFARGLSDGLLADLEVGAAAGLLAAWRDAGLDVRIREEAISAYDAGRRVGKLRRGGRGLVLEVHTKYLGGEGSTYVTLPVDDALVARLPAMREAAARFRGLEEVVEEAVVRANAAPPLQVLDRQVQLPGAVGRMDVVGVTAEAFVVVELKRDLDNRIQEVPLQVAGYVRLLDDGGLRADVAESYRRVCGQMRRLGLLAPDPEAVWAGMPVVGLIALARYNPRSKLWGRAVEEGRGLGVFVVHLDGTGRIPADWEPVA